MSKAIQDYYPDNYSHCYGCGSQNTQGHQLKSYWVGEHAIAHFPPKDYQTGGVVDKVYGGLIASLIDCHGIATAIAQAYILENRSFESLPHIRFVTGGLQVAYIKPTPIEHVLELKSHVIQEVGRKVVVDVVLSSNGEVCAEGRVTSIRVDP